MACERRIYGLVWLLRESPQPSFIPGEHRSSVKRRGSIRCFCPPPKDARRRFFAAVASTLRRSWKCGAVRTIPDHQLCRGCRRRSSTLYGVRRLGRSQVTEDRDGSENEEMHHSETAHEDMLDIAAFQRLREAKILEEETKGVLGGLQREGETGQRLLVLAGYES
ncbi:hypothetical protein GWK47_049363 [Chionoecetes opilio]|uniref:Uncharacterized protein n=1 Tax=Chionoecetes opilio TaxID=41210 RepID=A0A8J4Y3I2_CHIOP|nr:hypothetical protein GWK47_049363 [Chionoecetes opilio]